ncbi:phenylalanine ammonia-lyase [Puccinia sorghi]|uniref:Phenylalanine ammonia-lyase n=1 Tax=Puccinia sorghi TaxID=27349 RepID=A0A0L6V0S1_9BASI|nr:phenylalanine ammonia-lyase [Puccinia sorghi]
MVPCCLSCHFNGKNAIGHCCHWKNHLIHEQRLSLFLNGQEPSKTYHTKGLDTSCAAYPPQLQYLVDPVKTHFHSSQGNNPSTH